MRKVTAALIVATLAGIAGIAAPASAQTPPATIGQQYVPAPWWMRDPVIASIGSVRVEIPANRAGFSASFQSIERSATESSRKAADQVRALSQALAAYGVDKVRVETRLTTRPLYEQYRDEAGVMRDNVRPDKINRYQTEASVQLTLRDTALLERVYATVVASQPMSISSVNFRLEPENVWKTNLAAEAMKDARSRALAAATNAGASLGSVRVIDPTGRACETDVLAGWPSYTAGGGQETTVDRDVVVTGSRMAAPPPPYVAPRRRRPPGAGSGAQRGGHRGRASGPAAAAADPHRQRLRGLRVELSIPSGRHPRARPEDPRFSGADRDGRRRPCRPYSPSTDRVGFRHGSSGRARG
ncbi:SIMPL domain-containing protein [Brevundimonas goettingensis]|uniref:SIMPL domain-containing protein n=1 Tax=Brevundimonas goettingensis TaxID=2774190 RepID=UPI001A9F665C|nr:SIMPL domain-containing protein [Brevundimonas goettingensis]